MAGIVDTHCREREAILRHALERDAAGQDWVAGVGTLSNPDVSTALFRDFQLCLRVRQVADRARLSTDFQGASERLGERADQAGRHEALATMVELFSKLNGYPVKP